MKSLGSFWKGYQRDIQWAITENMYSCGEKDQRILSKSSSILHCKRYFYVECWNICWNIFFKQLCRHHSTFCIWQGECENIIWTLVVYGTGAVKTDAFMFFVTRKGTATVCGRCQLLRGEIIPILLSTRSNSFAVSRSPLYRFVWDSALRSSCMRRLRKNCMSG